MKSEEERDTQKSGTNIEERAKVRVQLHQMNLLLLNINYKNNNDTMGPMGPQVQKQILSWQISQNNYSATMYFKIVTFTT